MRFRTFAKRSVIAASVALSVHSAAHAVDETWGLGSTSTNDFTLATNWQNDTLPIGSRGYIGDAGPHNPVIDSSFSVGLLTTTSGTSTPTSPTTPSLTGPFTLTGTGDLTITGTGSSGLLGNASNALFTVDVNTTFTGRSNYIVSGDYTDGDAATGGSGNFVFGSPSSTSTLKWAYTGTSSNTQTIYAADSGANTGGVGTSVTIYSKLDHTGETGVAGSGSVSAQISLRPDSQSTIQLLGGIIGRSYTSGTNRNRSADASKLVVIDVLDAGQTGGKVILGDSTGWEGLMRVNTADLEIYTNNSLGTAGTSTPGADYTEIMGAASTGTLRLTGGITSDEQIYAYARSSTANAHLRNISGSNTLTKSITDDSTAANGAIVISSDGTGVGDLLTLAGGLTRAGNKSNDLILQGAGNGIVSGPINTTGTGSWSSVQKNDAGTWTLSGANTYLGNTTINGGTLKLTGTGTIVGASINVGSGTTFDVSTLAGGFNVASGQTLKGFGTVAGQVNLGGSGTRTINPGDISTVGTLSTGALNLTGDGILAYDLTSTPTNLGGINDLLSVTGNLTLAGTTTISVSAPGGLNAGTYNLLNFTGSLTGNQSNFALSGVSGGGLRRTFNVSTSTPGQVNLIVAGPGTPSSTLTWVGGNNANAWDTVVTVNWSGGSGGDNRFFAGDSVEFTDTGSNSPAVNVVGNVSPNAILFTNSTGHDYTISGSGNITASGGLSTSGTGNATFSNSGLSIAGEINHNGSGNLNVTSGSLAVAGNVNVNGNGGISFTNDSVAINGTLSTFGSGNVNLSNNGNFTLTGGMSLNGSGVITVANSGTLSLPASIGLNAGTLELGPTSDTTVSSDFSGSGTLTKVGTAALTFNGNNSAFGGPINVTSGTLKASVKNPNAFGTGTLTVSNGATVEIGSTKFVNKVFNISGSGAAGQLGALVDTAGLGTAAANRGTILGITLSGDASIGSAANTYPIIDGNATPGSFFDAAGHSVTFNGLGEWDFYNTGESNIANLTLNDGATYFGGTTTLGSAPGVVTLQNGGYLGLDNSPTVTKDIVTGASGNEGVTAFNNNNTVSSQVTINGSANFEALVYSLLNAATPLNEPVFTFSGKITGSGNFVANTSPRNGTIAAPTAGQLAIIDNNWGKVVLTSNDNDYAGTTTIGGSGLFAPVANPAYNHTTLSVGDGGTTGKLGAGDVIINSVGILQFNRNDTFTVPNNISGTGGSVTAVATAGNVTLSGNLTYTGNTTVSAGTLNLTGSHTGGANYSVAAGANLNAKSVVVSNTFTVDGNVTIFANGGPAGASKAETLAISAGGKLNLKDNDLVVGTAADVNAVRDAIKLGLTGTAGITSDLPAFATTTGFGYAMGNDAAISPLLAGSLSGQSYDTDSVLVKYTFLGDADLDGDSDLNDLGLWAQAFTGDLGNPVNPATYWTSGDFDYDGDTDLNDLGFWAGTFTGDLGGGAGSLIVHAPNAPAGAVAALNSMGITVVPEPSTFVLAGVGLAGLAIAARRKQK